MITFYSSIPIIGASNAPTEQTPPASESSSEPSPSSNPNLSCPADAKKYTLQASSADTVWSVLNERLSAYFIKALEVGQNYVVACLTINQHVDDQTLSQYLSSLGVTVA